MADSDPTPSSGENPILCSPYEEPHRHWELDQDGRATDKIIDCRRPSSPAIHVVPGSNTPEHNDDNEGTHARINAIRRIVSEWRSGGWPGATTVTKTLLAHWQDTEAPPLYWAQIEAVETLIWLYEVAPSSDEGRSILDAIDAYNAKYNSDGDDKSDHDGVILNRLASKMATGTGKTTVMALIIAWQGCNASLDPKRFSSQFIVMSPSTTIQKRLAELDPQYRENVYESMSIIPPIMRKRLSQATVLVRTYHAFQRQDLLARLGAGSHEKSVLRGRSDGDTMEGVGAMVRRVLGLRLDFGRPFIVINDEAHHCYKPGTARVRDVKKSDVEKAALWYNAIRHMAVEGRGRSGRTLLGVYDLSATPRFIERGEARADALFPWTVSDFPLTDSIECGMVKIPRVPVGRPIIDKTLCRNIYANTESDKLSADGLPDTVERPLNALYNNYAGVYKAWEKAGWDVPPVFVIVANTIENANELARYVSTDGHRDRGDTGKFDLFTNKEDGPVRTLLVHSSLAEGDLTDSEIKKLSVREMAERLGRPGEGLDAVREALDTVGKVGRLGEGIRCVVSVSMLTEGWDARNVTHIFGFRRFGTQLICEQVVGRALRRPDTESPGWYTAPEYADIFGVPFNYMLEPTKPLPPPPPPGKRIDAKVSRDVDLALEFPMVTKYDMLRTSGVEITLDEKKVRSNALNIERLEGVYGDTANIDTERCSDVQSAVYAIAAEVVKKYAADAPSVDRGVLFTKVVPIVHRWINLAIKDAEKNSRWLCSTQNMTQIVENIRQVCKITQSGMEVVPHPTVELVATTRNRPYSTVIKLDASGRESDRAYLHPSKCSHTAAACDSALEARVAKTLDKMPTVKSWMRNHRRVGWCLPYYYVDRWRLYYPDFVARVDAGDGGDFFCIIEVKGQDNDQARAKAHYARDIWVRAVNSVQEHGRWTFVQIGDEKTLSARLEAVSEEAAWA